MLAGCVTVRTVIDVLKFCTVEMRDSVTVRSFVVVRSGRVEMSVSVTLRVPFLPGAVNVTILRGWSDTEVEIAVVVSVSADIVTNWVTVLAGSCESSVLVTAA